MDVSGLRFDGEPVQLRIGDQDVWISIQHLTFGRARINIGGRLWVHTNY